MDLLFRATRHKLHRATIEKHSHCICRCEEAILILFGGMQADVEIVIARRKNHVVRHEVAVLVGYFSVVARS